MIRFRMEIAGEVQVDRAISRFAESVGDYRPVWPVIAEDFRAVEKRQFATVGVAGGEQWKPLSDLYADWKAVHFPGKPILERTGALVRSLTVAGAPGAVQEMERKSLTLGTTIDYAIYHQRGTSRMPARPEVRLTEEFKRTSMHHLHLYLVRMASAAGLRTGRTPGTPGPVNWQARRDAARRQARNF